MKRFGLFVIVVVLVAVGFGGGVLYMSRTSQDGSKKGERKVLYWIDPMHPAYKSDKPGIAPDCGMKLEPVYEDGGPATQAAAGDRTILHYRDPQSPEYKSDKPGLNPETGNELEPVYADGASTLPMGTIQISPEKQQLIGVRYGVVESSSGTHTFRAVGKVAYDETRIARVHTKVEGWIDRVFVDFTGDVVKKGQPMLTLYSPELLATQQEFILAQRGREIMKSSTLKGASEQGESLLAAARKRLELWDLTEDQINELARTRKPITNITIEAPVTGYVTARNAFPKQRINPDTELYTVVDLSKVWIMADVFENEASMVKLGQAVTVRPSYTPSKVFTARVSYIQPQVDAMTRTLKVRLEADNPNLELKPDMFADVTFSVPMPRKVTVPAEAVLDAGIRQTVFVDRGNGYLEPRQVQTGERVGDRVEVVSGLKAGERVATSGNFLIDSESQLKSAAAGMGAHQHGGSGGGGSQNAPAPDSPAHAEHGAQTDRSKPSPAQPAQHSSGHEGHKQ
ncbi:MAG TPA: efflux RND transporter periplasmic adaptor subunit [Bryobacteraceae bacterium]|nr:efflux RND transporter periplasmic adaptor subunit [Bryobacteraceae bacterium]